MFLSSTIYHITNKDILKNRWRIVDHISIFLLIGSSYTAFILLYYPTSFGLKFLAAHWVIIVFGIIFKLIFKTRFEIVSLALYLCLGWMVVFIYQDITANMTTIVENWLLAGSAFYTIGVLFYIQTKLAWNHAIWHIFVIFGCASHYLALYLS
jgi:hemolysin III